MDELLRQSGMGKSAFFQAFRQLTGTSPARYADRVRLEHARGLLLGTDWSVEQVASCCGYEDPFYFSRCFRKEFGLSPRKYRQANPVE